jgi:type IV pilus assembly protein PilA
VELLIAVAIISLILVAAVPNLMNAHRNANELAVMKAIDTVHTGQMQYLSQFGDFASTLAELGPPVSGMAGPHGAKLIPASLSSGERNGYRFTMLKTPTGFMVNANPNSFGKDGRRTFYMDEDGILRQNWGPEPATANSPEAAQTKHPSQ